jgi:ceramide glucosyltransferase
MSIFFGLLTVCSLGYCAVALWSARAFRRENQQSTLSSQHSAGQEPSSAPTPFTPLVSILKPLKGTDPAAYENLRSHCVQDYPEYELIFGVNEESDPAAELVRRLRAEFPTLAMRMVVGARALGTNRKVSNLVHMLEQARHQYVVVNDSDISVSPDYLRRVLAPFAEAKVGMVTCPYRGVAGRTLASKLEALGISTDFIPGVLTARALDGGVKFGLGSTMAVKREALAAIGGFEALVDYLADDYELGARVAAAGQKVVLSECVVENHLPDYRFGEFVAHQLRWGRTVRDSRWQYRLYFFTFTLFWAALTAIAARGAAWSLGLLGAALVLRAAVAYEVGWRVLRDPLVPRAWWLLPLRDLLAPFVWAATLFGKQIMWRGERFLVADRKLIRVEPTRS